MDGQEWLKLKQAAEYLQMHYQTMWKLIKDKKIPAKKMGGTWRVKREDLENYIEESDSN